MTPAAVEDEVRRAAAPLPRARGARRGDLRQPARRARGRAGLAAKWINQYDGLDNVIAHADEITGKEGEALREHLGDVIRNRRLNALVCDLDLELRPTTSRAEPWDRAGGAHALRRPGVPGAARPAVRDAATSEEPTIDDSGFELDGARARRRARSPAGSAEHAGAGRARRRARAGHWRRRHRRRRGARAGRRRRPGGLARRRPRSTPEDDAALAAWLADPDRPKVLHDAKGPMLALRGPRLAAARARSATPRSSAYLVPARPALLRPGRPDRCATSSASCSRTTADDGQLQLRRLDGDGGAAETAMLHARAVLDLADALDDELERARRHPAARRRRAAAGRRARRAWSRPASPSTSTTSSRSRREFAGEVRDAAAEALTR